MLTWGTCNLRTPVFGYTISTGILSKPFPAYTAWYTDCGTELWYWVPTMRSTVSITTRPHFIITEVTSYRKTTSFWSKS